MLDMMAGRVAIVTASHGPHWFEHVRDLVQTVELAQCGCRLIGPWGEPGQLIQHCQLQAKHEGACEWGVGNALIERVLPDPAPDPAPESPASLSCLSDPDRQVDPRGSATKAGSRS